MQQDHEHERENREHRRSEVQRVRHPPEVGALVGPDGGALSHAAAPAAGGEVGAVRDAPDVDDDLLAGGREPLQVADGGRVRDAVRQGLAVVDLDGVVRGLAAVAAYQRARRLLVVQPRRQEQAVEPRRPAHYGGSVGDRPEVCERDQPAR